MDVTETWPILRQAPAPRTMLFDFESVRAPRHPQEVQPRLEQVSVANLRKVVDALSRFETRYFMSPKGVQAAEWVEKVFQQFSAGRNDIQVERHRHAFAQPSIIATMKGTRRPDEIVILGAHLDSISMSPMKDAPGADDDASGVATIIEVFRVLAASGFRPERTIQFMAYAGEEVGLRGSLDLAALYKKQKRKVVAAIQFDMTMYPAKSKTLTFVTDYVDNSLNRFLAMLQDTYVKKPWKTGDCGYACSDHASWSRAGYAAAFPTEAPMDEMFPKIHTPGDLPHELDAVYGLQFAQLGLAAAIELALP